MVQQMSDRTAAPEYHAFVSVAEAFQRYRPAIDAGLRETMSQRELPFYEMLRYHLGLDAEGSGAGKALRPTLCLLVCESLGGPWQQAVPAATSIELIHNFSLIHDDIQDGDTERRHRPALWSRYGLAQGINAGDAMFCMATLVLCRLRESFHGDQVVDVIRTVHEAAEDMIEGQYLDVTFESRPEVSREEYLQMIGRKTGALLRASIEVGATLAGAGAETRGSCREFGESIGRLFQIRDDMLGVWGRPEQTGKPVHSDIRRRKKSMPIVMALSLAGPAERASLMDLYQREAMTEDDVQRVLDLFEQLDVRQKVQDLADETHREASALARSIEFGGRGEMLSSIVDFLLSRDY